MELRICHLYPDLLNINGEKGNIIALTKRARWRGIEVSVDNISLNDEFESDQYDIFFLLGGQEFELEIIREDFVNNKGAQIRSAIENGKVFLATCIGFQLLGNFYQTADGTKKDLLGALNIWTVAGTKRLTGNLVFESEQLKGPSFDGKIVGFENHLGRTYLGEGVIPLGRVLKGFGNNGEDHLEGAVYKNTICSYSHGSLLPENPALTDILILKALEQKYENVVLEPLDDSLEYAARNAIISRILSE